MSLAKQFTPILAAKINFVTVSLEDAINKKIREVMEVPADGQVSITFKKGGIGVYDVR